jgi:hypothetical protein
VAEENIERSLKWTIRILYGLCVYMGVLSVALIVTK